MQPIVLGTGWLTWMRGERVSDRYGAVYLIANMDSEESLVSETAVDMCEGKKGRLVAHVLEVRESHHIGDFFRGLVPGGAKVGMQIELGVGTLFSEIEHHQRTVGLKPTRKRASDWLDSKALYVAHDQTVRLEFHPEVP